MMSDDGQSEKTQEDKAPPAAESGAATVAPGVIGHPVPLSLFTILYFYSFSLYLIYWSYRALRNLQVPGPGKAGTVVYAIFFPFSFHALMKRFEERAAQAGVPVVMHRIALAVSYFVLQGGVKLLNHNKLVILGLVVNALALVPVLIAQHKMNKVNKELNPDLPGLAPYNIVHWIIIGLLAAGYLAFVFFAAIGQLITK